MWSLQRTTGNSQQTEPTHTLCQESNPDHTGSRQVFSPLPHLCSPPPTPYDMVEFALCSFVLGQHNNNNNCSHGTSTLFVFCPLSSVFQLVRVYLLFIFMSVVIFGYVTFHSFVFIFSSVVSIVWFSFFCR